jgi:hypothetical protein
LPLSQINVEYACGGYKRGTLDPQDRRHALAQLRAEGRKRLESFLFEPIFIGFLVNCLGPSNVALNWLFVSDKHNQPQFWFKLMVPERPWNIADDSAVALLSRRKCAVFKIGYDIPSRKFFGFAWADGCWRDRAPIENLLGAALERNEPRQKPRNTRDAGGPAQLAALAEIESRFSDADLFNLSISRTLINCLVAPWFGTQPMDIDAVCMAGGRTCFVEFKRKYPARSGTFGIDESPHGSFIDWLAREMAPLFHVILCDPLWNKSVSPVHLLESGSRTAAHALWLGAALDATAFTGRRFSTSGHDSGMYAGNRSQREIRLAAFRLLSKGMEAPDLLTFLQNPCDLPTTTALDLERAHQAGVNEFKRLHRTG